MSVLTHSEIASTDSPAERPEQDTAVSPDPAILLVWATPENMYETFARLCPETEGGFSVYCPLLPGVVSQGDTREEAIEMITEALAGAIRSYLASNEPIPWLQDEPASEEVGEEEVWITVNV